MQTFLAQISQIFQSGQKGRYNYGYDVLNGQTRFNSYEKDTDKLKAALANPALLKVISLQCDMFSLGEFYLKDNNDKLIENDPLLTLLNKPNPFSSSAQFKWDYMFWTMLGNSYLYIDSNNINIPNNKMYFLQNRNIDFPTSLEMERDKLIFSESKLKEILNTIITYNYDNGGTYKFPLYKLLISHDLTNGIGNLFKGASKIDALYKIISNSEYTLDSKNINLRYSGKFMVGSDNDETKVGLTPEEKESINENMSSDDKEVYPMGSLVSIRRFVEDMGKLKLDESYLNDYFVIGNMFSIPRDVLEAYNSSTYENQEKARGSHVSYTLQPKGDDFCNKLTRHFDYTDKRLCIDWSYLPFMQVFENENAKAKKTKVETLEKLINLGYKKEEAEKIVNLY